MNNNLKILHVRVKIGILGSRIDIDQGHKFSLHYQEHSEYLMLNHNINVNYQRAQIKINFLDKSCK